MIYVVTAPMTDKERNSTGNAKVGRLILQIENLIRVKICI